MFELMRLRYIISKMALRIKRYTYEQTPFLKSMIEKGETNIPTITLLEIAKALNVHPKIFFDFK